MAAILWTPAKNWVFEYSISLRNIYCAQKNFKIFAFQIMKTKTLHVVLFLLLSIQTTNSFLCTQRNRIINSKHFVLSNSISQPDVFVIGVAADSGCGKSTFVKRLINILGGSLFEKFGKQNERVTNTLVAENTTVICLDDYHKHDRYGRKKTGLTALHIDEQNFDLMAEQVSLLKSGKSITKPVYNHATGTLDAPETINPTPLIILEGLHPMIDSRVRHLLDFTVYLDIADDIKYNWKMRRDTRHRGWTVEEVYQDIKQRKPDYEQFISCQREYADMIIRTDISRLCPNRLHVQLIQPASGTKKPYIHPSYILNPQANVTVQPILPSQSPIQVASYPGEYSGREVMIMEMHGKVMNIDELRIVESLLSNSSTKHTGEISDQIQQMGIHAPGSLEGTGFLQTLVGMKIRDYYHNKKH